MNPDLRLIILCLDAFAAASLAASVTVFWLARRPLPIDVGTRATLLFLTRLLPTAAGVLGALGALVTNFLTEPQASSARLGITLVLLAAVAALMLAAAVARAILLWLATRRVLRRWLRDATPIHLPGSPVPAYSLPAAFPIVAVVGILSPRLFIAESILRSCTPSELAAILAHETSHVRRRDNLCRGLMATAPDLLHLVPVGRRLSAAWHRAIERRADAAVHQLGTYGPIHLAQALVRVARLATAPVQPPLPASALYGGGDIESRVRHLIDPAVRPSVRLPRPALALMAAMLVSTASFGAAQTAMDLAIRHLP
jgi:Zn-dependent protease with chaperone function